MEVYKWYSKGSVRKLLNRFWLRTTEVTSFFLSVDFLPYRREECLKLCHKCGKEGACFRSSFKYPELEKLVDLGDSSLMFLYTLLSLKNELSLSSLKELKKISSDF